MIKATNKNYIIKACGQDTKTESGLIIKNTDETEFAEILSAGPEIENPIPVGTKVVANWQNTLPIMHNKERVFIIRSENVLGYLEDE